MGGITRLRALTATGIVFACICGLLGSAGATLARSSGSLRAVRYRGFSVRVPRSWPVFNLARDPRTCLRFDRHALYLGTPGREERCPAHAVGRTEAILISPLHARPGAPSSTASGLGLVGDASSFSVSSAGVEVTATWSRDPQVVARAFGLRSLPGAGAAASHASRTGAAPASNNATEQSARPFAKGSVYRGLGFDTCAAPSTSQMSAWSASPYRAVGIYLGGVNAGCAQPNLNEDWIDHEVASGWHPIPIWVGLEAPSNLCGCRAMSTNTARAHIEGQTAAGIAATRAERLGIRAGNPIYEDMEGYATGGSNTPAVLAFLSGWTSGLHAHGYLSGVYSSDSSGIRDLVSRYGTGYTEPDDIWIAAWNGVHNTRDPYVPRADWSNHQRLHQYEGNDAETYGGVTLTVDDDFLNGATANAQDGYMILTSNGGIHRFGPILGHGSDAGKMPPGIRAVALARDRKTGGYWILRSDGGLKGFDAPFHGSLRHKLGGKRPVALAGSPGGGYLVLTSNGAVHRFGPARAYGGDVGKLPGHVRAVALAVDSQTGGYWILTSAGGVNHFHAPWDGSLRHKLGGARAVSLAAARQGGYFILTSNGAVHPFGGAKFEGSLAGKLSAGVTAVSLATSATAKGYRILRSDGGVSSFGAAWYGSLAGKVPGGSSPLTIADATS